MFHLVPKNGLPGMSGKWLSFTWAFERLRENGDVPQVGVG